MLYYFVAALLGVSPSVAPDTVVVCPPALRQALQPWVTHRQEQGHCLTFIDRQASAAAIRDEICQIAKSGKLRSVVLVGDVQPPIAASETAAWATPTHHVPAKVNVHWGSEPEIATDNCYGDLDLDGVPELAVGRLSVRNPEQLTQLVQKILAYERSTDFGPWRRRVNLVAGVGGFSPLADTILEMATKKFLTEGIPDDYETSMTYASWQSPFCPDPRQFRDVVLRRLNEGCLFWVYIGHGHHQQLDRVQIPAASYPIFQYADAAGLQAEHGQPIALMLACYTGAFDQPFDCLGEAMLRGRGGPVAVVCGSRVTMPYALAVMSNALMEQVFQSEAKTLGEMICQAKRDVVTQNPDDSNRQLLDAIAAAISPAADLLDAERLEHVALLNLLGDPLLRIHRPSTVQVTSPESASAGQSILVRGNSEIAGEGVVEIVSRRDRLKVDLPSRRSFHPADEFLRSFDPTYLQANDRVWSRHAFTADGQPFEMELPLPEDTRGHCYVRVWVQGNDASAQGATRIFVRRPQEVAAE